MIRRINYHEASRPHQIRIKRRIRQKLFQMQNEVLTPHGLKFRKIEIEKSQNNIQDRIEDFTCEIIFHQADGYVPIRNVIYVKDKHNISDVTYTSLSNDLQLNLPSLYEIKQQIKIYDQMINIEENSKGVYLNIKEKLKYLIPKIRNNFVDKESNILHIKFSADGAQIVKNKILLNITFTILNEGKIAETASGNYTCGLFDITKEDYETIRVCLEEIKTQIDLLSDLEIDGIKYKIEKYIGGDLKMC